MISENQMTSKFEDTATHLELDVSARALRALGATAARLATDHGTQRYGHGYAAGRHDGATDGPPLRPLLRDQALRDRVAGIALLLPHTDERLNRVRVDLLTTLLADPDDEACPDVVEDPLLRDALADVVATRTREGDHGEDVEFGVLAIDDESVVRGLVAWSDARHAQPESLDPGAGACPLCSHDVHTDWCGVVFDGGLPCACRKSPTWAPGERTA